MKLVASDIITLHRHTPCELRIYLRHNGAPEAEPGPFDEVLRRLGMRHEQQHLSTLGAYVDLSHLPESDRTTATHKAIHEKALVIYQPVFAHAFLFNGVDVTVLGTPAFLIVDVVESRIRD